MIHAKLFYIKQVGQLKQDSRMTRPLRLKFAGALYHVTSRGERREDIYEDDEDRQIPPSAG